jgi:uncharacterized protein (TIGR02145 family)
MGLEFYCNSNRCSDQISSPHRGICPPGWHIPSDAEWQTLIDFAGGNETAGAILKAASGWNSNGNGTDDYGFSALPGGEGNSGGRFLGVGYYGIWWSATERNSYYAYRRGIGYDDSDVGRYDDDKYANLLSVRCLLD